jgi:hypothetical protein
MIKIKAKINELGTKKKTKKTKHTKTQGNKKLVFKKINKIYKSLENLTKMQREKDQN